jgi:flagellar hook-associated protein FlgK
MLLKEDEMAITKEQIRKQALYDISQLEDAIEFEQDKSDRERQETVDKINSYRERIKELKEIVTK